MSWPPKQRENLNKIRHCKDKSILAVNELNEQPPMDDIQYIDDQIQCKLNDPKLSPTECVFTILISGQTFTNAQKLAVHMNWTYTSKASFFRAQKKILQVLEDYA